VTEVTCEWHLRAIGCVICGDYSFPYKGQFVNVCVVGTQVFIHLGTYKGAPRGKTSTAAVER
jgi:hypothetical protein